MKMRLLLLVVGVLVAGVLVACGGDDENSGGGGGDTSAQTDTGGSGGGETSEDTGGSGGGGADPSDPQVKQAVEACEQQIGAQPNISEDVKSDLQELCKKAASGDAEEVKQATKEVCLKLVEETTKNLPPGAGDQAKEQAKAACNQATATP